MSPDKDKCVEPVENEYQRMIEVGVNKEVNAEKLRWEKCPISLWLMKKNFYRTNGEYLMESHVRTIDVNGSF